MSEPTYQPWEVVSAFPDLIVQQPGNEQRFTFTYSSGNSAGALANLLNELDRARALIAAIADLIESPDWTHESDSADDGWHIYCQGRSIISTMLEDYDAGR